MLDKEMKPPRTGHYGLTNQIRALHPSCMAGNLTQSHRIGTDRVEAILGYFCKVRSHINDATGDFGVYYPLMLPLVRCRDSSIVCRLS